MMSIRRSKSIREKHLPAAEIPQMNFARMEGGTTTWRETVSGNVENGSAFEVASAKLIQRSVGLLDGELTAPLPLVLGHPIVGRVEDPSRTGGFRIGERI
jgi:hypothetical protein